MHLGRVIGTVVATRKVQGLIGVRLYLMQPLSNDQVPYGEPIVACDTVGARDNDLVMWVSSREASLAMEEKFVPVDAAIIGLVDDVHVESTCSYVR